MDYVSLRVSTLRGDQKIDFDAYLKINDKMILYLRRGDSFEGQRLKRLKEKKLKKMFIMTQDESNYRNYLQRNIEQAYDDNSGKDISVRSEIIQGQQQSNAEEVFENPENVQAYLDAKDMAGKYVHFLLKNPNAIASVMNIENLDKNTAHHGVSVATLAIALADKLGLKDEKQNQIMSLGALLHDFGHHESTVSQSMMTKDMSPEQLAIYREHPLVGAQKVRDKKHFDTGVIRIITEHEETIDGQGYPHKLVENKMDPLSIIVGCCNAADRLVTFEGVPKNEVAKKLVMDFVGKYPLTHLQNLSAILKEHQS